MSALPASATMGSDGYAFSYDLFTKTSPELPEEIRFIDSLCDDRPVLDFGCGTAIIASGLLDAGRTVVCYDPDPAMLRIARARIGGSRRAVVVSSISDLEAFDGRCGLAVARGVFPHMLDRPSRCRGLLAMRAALGRGGRLLCDFRLHALMADDVGGAEAVDPASGRAYSLTTSRVRRSSSTHETTWSISDGGDGASVSWTSRVRDDSLPGLKRLLRRTGFELRDLHDGFAAKPYSGTYRVVVAVARRAEPGGCADRSRSRMGPSEGTTASGGRPEAGLPPRVLSPCSPA